MYYKTIIMFLHIPNENPIFIDSIYVQHARDTFPSYNLEPGITPDNQYVWSINVHIVYSDTITPGSLSVEYSDSNSDYVEDQFFGWLAYVRQTNRPMQYWRLQMNHIVINHTGFLTLEYSKGLYATQEFPLR